MISELLTTEELADRLKVSTARIESWRSNGEGPALHPRRQSREIPLVRLSVGASTIS